jgi:hypothetical protein
VNQSADREYNNGKFVIKKLINRRGLEKDRGICSVVLGVCRIMGSIYAWNDIDCNSAFGADRSLAPGPHSRSWEYCPSEELDLFSLSLLFFWSLAGSEVERRA